MDCTQRRVAFQRPQRGHPDHRHLVAGEPVLGEQLADLQLDQVEQLGVVDRVGLVHRDHEVRHADPPREQHVLARLRHDPVQRRDDQDGPSTCAAPVIMFFT